MLLKKKTHIWQQHNFSFFFIRFGSITFSKLLVLISKRITFVTQSFQNLIPHYITVSVIFQYWTNTAVQLQKTKRSNKKVKKHVMQLQNQGQCEIDSASASCVPADSGLRTPHHRQCCLLSNKGKNPSVWKISHTRSSSFSFPLVHLCHIRTLSWLI